MENTPFSVMSEMTERNLDMWKAMQENFLKAYGVEADENTEVKPRKDDE